MKVLKVSLVAVLFLHGLVYAQSAPAKFEYLKQYSGQYPYNVKLLESKPVKQALIALIGISRYQFIKTNCGVENPMEVKDGVFTSTACQQHNCSDTNYIIVINIPDGTVYAGIRKDGKVTLYPSGTTGIPQLAAWLNN